MNNSIQIFNNKAFGTIRTTVDSKGETFFVGMDVAKALGYTNTRDALAKHVEKDDKTTVAIRDGYIYITEKKKRKYNKPIFREDHSSLSLGTDGKYYFYFAMSAELVDELPDRLAHEALVIAQKVVNEILYTEVAEEVEK